MVMTDPKIDGASPSTGGAPHLHYAALAQLQKR